MNDAIGIGINDRFEPLRNKRSIVVRLGDHGVLDQEQFRGWNINGLESGGLRGGRDDDFGIEILQHALEPLRWRFDIKVGVAVAAVENTDVRDNIAGAFGKENRDWFM